MKKLNEKSAMKNANKLLVFILMLLAGNNLKAANYYWVGGTGNWNDVTHWATTSGGAVNFTSPPLQNDDVIIDNNSFSIPNGIIILPNGAITCRDLTISNTNLSDISGNISIQIFGSLNLNSTVNFFQLLALCATNPSTYTIKTFGNTINLGIIGQGSIYNFQDAFTGDLYIAGSEVFTNNFSPFNIISNFNILNGGVFHQGTTVLNVLNNTNMLIDSTAFIDAGLGEINVTGLFTHSQNGIPLKINKITAGSIAACGDSIIDATITGTIATQTSFAGLSDCYVQKLDINSPLFYATIVGNSFLPIPYFIDTLIMNTTASIKSGQTLYENEINNLFIRKGDTCFFGHTDTTLINSIQIFGSSNNRTGMFYEAFPSGNNSHIKTPNPVCLDSMVIGGIIYEGSSVFNGGANSIDAGGNSGISFTNCPPPPANYYWVGGTGNWSDFANHWATTSGGSTFHTSEPDSTDDVFFDSNAGGGLVFLLNDAQCSNLTISDSIFIQSGGILRVFGSLQTNYSNVFNNNVALEFKGSGMHSISSTDSGSVLNFGLAASAVFFNCPNGTYFINANLLSVYLYFGGGAIYFMNNAFASGYELIVNSSSYSPGNSVDIYFNDGSFNFGTVSFQDYGSSGSFDADSATFITGDFYCSIYQGKTFMDVTAGGHLYSYANNFNNVEAHILEGNGNYIDSLTTSTVFTDDDSAHLGKNIINVIGGDGLVPSSLVFEGNQTSVTKIDYSNLIEILILAGDTLFLTGNMNFGDQIMNEGVWSGLIGQPSYISCNSNLPSCIRNTTLYDIHVISTAAFYADTSCTDNGGNAGWTWAPCSPVGNVWPGDANYDLIVSNNDVLNIGLAYNETGPVRVGATLNYVAQPATDWSGYFQTGVNKKHADTNGDGLVDDNDTLAIVLNYGLNHPARYAQGANQNATGPLLYLVASADSAALTDTVYVEAWLGTSQFPADSIYGIAFSISYDTALVDTNWFSFDFLPSWFGTPGVDELAFVKNIPLEGRMDFALTRTDHNNASGFGGPLTRTGIVIVDNVAGRMPLPFTISNVYALTASEFEIFISTLGDTVSVDTTALTGINEWQQTIVHGYPNPFGNFITPQKVNEKSNLQLINEMGQIVLSQTLYPNEKKVIDVRHLTKGIYIMNVFNDKINSRVKLVKL